MPRCLMAKKWKAYPWQDRAENTVTNQQITEITDTVVSGTTDCNIEIIAPAIIEDDEEIDVVGDSPAANATSSVINSYNANIDTDPANSTVIVGKTSVIPTCWGPSSPTAGTTAEEAHSSDGATRGSTILYNGKLVLQIFDKDMRLNLRNLHFLTGPTKQNKNTRNMLHITSLSNHHRNVGFFSTYKNDALLITK